MPAAPVGGEYRLTDHFGRTVTPASFADRHTLYFFGFTHCKVVCPETLGRLSRAIERSGVPSDKLQPLYVTVDPARDTPERMRSFLEASFPRFVGLTGDADAIEHAKGLFKVYAERRADPDDPAGYEMPHSAFSFLMDLSGDCVAYFTTVATVDDIAERLRTVIGKG